MNPLDSPLDEEIVYRHIPGGTTWQAPPIGRITSSNFRMRPDETGLSVSRALFTTSDQLMARLGKPGSKIASAIIAELRALGFEVVPVPLDDDPGHAEIRPVKADIENKAAQRALANVFRYV